MPKTKNSIEFKVNIKKIYINNFNRYQLWIFFNEYVGIEARVFHQIVKAFIKSFIKVKIEINA